MQYSIAPFAKVWSNGIFNVPNDVVDKYLKMASEYQLKALLFILRNGGTASSSSVAKALGHTTADIDELLEFWVEENLLSVDTVDIDDKAMAKASEKSGDEKSTATDTTDGNESCDIPQKQAEPTETKVKGRGKLQTAGLPTLTPKDIVVYAREDKNVSFLLNNAQSVLGRTISHAEQEMLVNMVYYYGLKVEVILMILEFYRSEKEKGKSIGMAYVNAMAKNWAQEGVDSITAAECKLNAIARSDKQWKEIVEMTGISHRHPTQKQREIVSSWYDSFDTAMISLAVDIMKENIPEPKLGYVNTILMKWKSNGITTPEQVEQEKEKFAEKKRKKSQGKLKSKPTYDIEKIKKDAMNNTDL